MGWYFWATVGAGASIVVYGSIFFLFSRLCVPCLGFRKERLPKRVPKKMERVIHYLRTRSKNKKEYLKRTYQYLTRKYQGRRRTVLKHPLTWFEINLHNIWKKRGFLPCHTFCHVMRVFLIKGRKFKEKDVRIKHTFFWFMIHQYLEVRIKKKWYKVDPWARSIGIKFGDHARLFK